MDLYDSQIQQKNRAIVFGDFNIDLLKTDRTTKQYKDLMKGAGYIILNKITEKYCSRESSTNKSIIDHIIPRPANCRCRRVLNIVAYLCLIKVRAIKYQS